MFQNIHHNRTSSQRVLHTQNISHLSFMICMYTPKIRPAFSTEDSKHSGPSVLVLFPHILLCNQNLEFASDAAEKQKKKPSFLTTEPLFCFCIPLSKNLLSFHQNLLSSQLSPHCSPLPLYLILSHSPIFLPPKLPSFPPKTISSPKLVDHVHLKSSQASSRRFPKETFKQIQSDPIRSLHQ